MTDSTGSLQVRAMVRNFRNSVLAAPSKMTPRNHEMPSGCRGLGDIWREYNSEILNIDQSSGNIAEWCSIVGLVVEFVVAIDEARVRFTDDAFFFAFFFLFSPHLLPELLQNLYSASFNNFCHST